MQSLGRMIVKVILWVVRGVRGNIVDGENMQNLGIDYNFCNAYNLV